jgi:membrane-bound serine protease (ClpP class)
MEQLMPAESLPWVYSIGLLILGFVLILLEIFVIPGVNIFGILGFGTVCVGVVFAYVRLGGAAAVMIGAIGVAGTAALVWLLVRNRAWQNMVHAGRTDRASGFDSSTGEWNDLVGAVGTAITTLRPSGRVRFDERIVDVVTDGGFIPTGASVEVLEVHGNRIVVHQRAE